MKRISLCTYSKNRIEQVKRYFRFACEVMSSEDEIIYVDYNDPMYSANFVSKIPMDNIRVFKVDEVKYWNMNHARNCAGIKATGDILFFCDIDVFITKEIVDFIRKEVTENIFVMAGHHSGLTFGCCAITKEMYEKVNGYEEMFSGWGWDDTMMYEMLKANGYRSKVLPLQLEKNHIFPELNRREGNSQSREKFNKKLLDFILGEGLKVCNFQRTIGLGCKPYVPFQEKILIDVPNGLNDCLSMLNDELEYCYRCSLDFRSIYLHSNVYEFSDFFDFKEINYIKSEETPKIEEFNKVINRSVHLHTLKYLDTEHHVSNFLSIKDEILQKYNEYHDFVAIHCRSIYGNNKNMEDFLKENLKYIEKIVSENEKVCIFSDTDLIFDYLPTGPNIIHEKSGANDMENHLQRKKCFEITVHQLVKIGKCKEVYVTNGFFWQSAKALVNKNIIVKKLQDS